MAGVHAPYSGITAIDGSSTAVAARQQHAGSPHADHLQRAVETLRRTRRTRTAARSRPPGGLPRKNRSIFRTVLKKILIGFLKSFWKVWKNFGAGFALR